MGDPILPEKQEEAWLGHDHRVSARDMKRMKKRAAVGGGAAMALGVVGSIDLIDKVQ